MDQEFNGFSSRLETIKNEDISVEEKNSKISEAKEDFIDLIQDKVDQNKINIKYAPNEDVEIELSRENEFLSEILSSTNDLDLQVSEDKIEKEVQLTELPKSNEEAIKLSEVSDFLEEANIENSSEDVVNDNSTFTETSVNIDEKKDSMEPGILLSEAEQDQELQVILDRGLRPIEYKSEKAGFIFNEQEQLYKERNTALKEDIDSALEKEIEILNKAKKANREEFSFVLKNRPDLDPETIEQAENDMTKASVLRASSVLKLDPNEKAFYLKNAYAYELKAIESISVGSASTTMISDPFEATKSIDEKNEIEDSEEEIFKSQAKEFGLNEIAQMDRSSIDEMVDHSERGIENILSQDLDYSSEGIEELKADQDGLSKVIKDWKIDVINNEQVLLEIKAEDYGRLYANRIKEYREIELKLDQTSDPDEIDDLNKKADRTIREADVLDHYQKIALRNIEIYESRKNDIVNGELEFASEVTDTEEENYLGLSDFINRYYEGESPFDDDGNVVYTEEELEDIASVIKTPANDQDNSLEATENDNDSVDKDELVNIEEGSITEELMIEENDEDRNGCC